MNLETENEVSVCIKNIDGKIIAKGDYGMMIGAHTLTFDASSFAKGFTK